MGIWLYRRMTQILILLFLAVANGETLSFPPDFQWCVATAGHQVEGDNVNSDWWAWEQLPGKIANGEKSGKAAYHMERLKEDVGLMKDFGVKTYRFSIEWSRIEPKEGEFDQAAVDYYRHELQLLKKAGISPMVTIHHFVQPQWFSASGGFRRADSPELFLRYVQKLDQEFGADINLWVTFNEPTVVLIGGFGLGFMPPGEKGWDYWDYMINILKAHAKAYHFLHAQADARGRKIQVGMAHHLRPGVGSNWLLHQGVKIANFFLTWNIPAAVTSGVVRGFPRVNILGLKIPYYKKMTVDGLKDTQDFIGINYYTREKIALSLKAPYLIRTPLDGMTGSDLNWGIDPKGFYEVLKICDQMFPKIPFYITENGLADAKDQWRESFVVTHLEELHRAMKDFKHRVEGYCHWSMMDNFEWQEGYTPRFGLFRTNYKKRGERTIKKSAIRVKEIFKSGKLKL